MTPRSPHSLRHLLAALGAVAALGATVACGSGPDAEAAPAEAADADAGAAPAPAPAPPASDPPVPERPWEVVSKKGETYLTNVFYADASENEQVMPWAIDGHVQIDRLVYPTIGNPNLVSKADPEDELVVVLRVEDAAFDFLSPRLSPVEGSALSRVDLAAPATEGDGFVFYLVPRSAREAATALPRAVPTGAVLPPGVVQVRPSAILQNPTPADLPARLAARRTMRFVFDRAALAGVPAGLYDVRFEVKKDGALHEPRGTGSGVYEYQYNAVRVFDAEPEEYDVVNVTDTQVSVGSVYDSMTKAQLDELVTHLATTKDPKVLGAPFMTFNGDLHNGGSPASLRQRTVATTYAAEAKVVLAALAKLPMPVFLTPGNHDGYVSIGQVPSAIKASDAAMLDDLKKVVEEASPRAWPGFTWDKYASYLDATSKADMLGGFHRDVFVGAFARTAKDSFAGGWKEVPREQRNIVLYDGFHQWQKTYGPLTSSWRFGKNRYVSLNTYELRQHRRSGWGMYTVNYGGNMSAVQMEWLDRELSRAKKEDSDVVLLAHHDPRGGHKGEDHGYYFEQLEYRGVSQSAINYLSQKVWNPAACAAPDWALTRSQEQSCVHDGLQEWMRPDEELDCTAEEKIPTEDGQAVCEKALFDPARGDRAHSYFWSGLELIKRVTGSPHVRTFLLGHTHYNELEVAVTGDALVPGSPTIGASGVSKAAFREIENPMRGYAVMQEAVGFRPDYDPNALSLEAAKQRVLTLDALLRHELPRAQRTLEGQLGEPRELVFLRTVSNANLATQTYNGKSALGYAVLRVRKSGTTATPRIGGATFYVNSAGAFNAAADVAIDRTTRLAARAPENPVVKAFRW